jgi:hypothetical protein
MTFKIQNQSENIQTLIRRMGYQPLGYTNSGELNCVRPIHGSYPRFHIYLKEEKDGYIFNLHLDQKKPSYEGSHAHAGDYDSETVREESERIKSTLR